MGCRQTLVTLSALIHHMDLILLHPQMTMCFELLFFDHHLQDVPSPVRLSSVFTSCV